MSKLTDDLVSMGFRTTRDLAWRGPVQVYIGYAVNHPHAYGYTDHRVTVYRRTGTGEVRFKELRPGGAGAAKENRERHLAAAIEYYGKFPQVGYSEVEWVRSPFTEHGWYWIPKQTYDAVMADVKTWRAEQKAKKDLTVTDS
jgi:hypothetical protein